VLHSKFCPALNSGSLKAGPANLASFGPSVRGKCPGLLVDPLATKISSRRAQRGSCRIIQIRRDAELGVLETRYVC